jgi:hypothetical protein
VIFKEKNGIWDLLVTGRMLSWYSMNCCLILRGEDVKRYGVTQGDREKFRELKGRTGSVSDNDSRSSMHSRASTVGGSGIIRGDDEFSRDMQEGIRVLEFFSRYTHDLKRGLERIAASSAPVLYSSLIKRALGLEPRDLSWARELCRVWELNVECVDDGGTRSGGLICCGGDSRAWM